MTIMKNLGKCLIQTFALVPMVVQIVGQIGRNALMVWS